MIARFSHAGVRAARLFHIDHDIYIATVEINEPRTYLPEFSRTAIYVENDGRLNTQRVATVMAYLLEPVPGFKHVFCTKQIGTEYCAGPAQIDTSIIGMLRMFGFSRTLKLRRWRKIISRKTAKSGN